MSSIFNNNNTISPDNPTIVNTSNLIKKITKHSEEENILSLEEMKRRLPRLFNSFRAKRVFLFNKTNHTDNSMEYSNDIFLSKIDTSPIIDILPSSSTSSSSSTTSSTHYINSSCSTTTTPEHVVFRDDPIMSTNHNGLDNIYENEDTPKVRLRENNKPLEERKESRARRNMKAVSAFMTTDVPQSIQGLFQRKSSTRSLRLKMNPVKEKHSKIYSEEVCIEFSDEEDDYEQKMCNDNMKDIEIVNDFQQCTVVEDMPSSTNYSLENDITKDTSGIASFVLAELMTTEQSYVRELTSLVDYYVIPFENLEKTNALPVPVRGKSKLIFGNLRDLLDYHTNTFLSALLAANNDIPMICRIFIKERINLLTLYRPYCQNKSQSEVFRREYVEGKKFFNDCQRRAGHLLPLSAYLLKPIQRITKYQLLLKELGRHCDPIYRPTVDTAIAAMLDLLSQLNSDMQQLRISGYTGDLQTMGCLRLHTDCEIMAFKRKNHKFNKPQQRSIFLFDLGIVLCKRRSQPITLSSDYYEFKICIPLRVLGFSELSRAGSDKFEIWDGTKSEGYAVTIHDDASRMKWIQKIGKHLLNISEKVDNSPKVENTNNENYDCSNGLQRNNRPQSWTSVDSTGSSRVSSEEGPFIIDPNGNRHSVASIDESNEDEGYDKRDIVDNNSISNHVTTIIVPSDQSSEEISSNTSQLMDTRSISEGQLQTMNGGVVVSESADCVSAAC